LLSILYELELNIRTCCSCLLSPQSHRLVICYGFNIATYCTQYFCQNHLNVMIIAH